MLVNIVEICLVKGMRYISLSIISYCLLDNSLCYIPKLIVNRGYVVTLNKVLNKSGSALKDHSQAFV